MRPDIKWLAYYYIMGIVTGFIMGMVYMYHCT